MISPMFAMAFWLRALSIRYLTHDDLSFSKFVQTYYILNLSERIYRHLTVFLTLVTYLQVQIVHARLSMMSGILKAADTRRNGWTHLVVLRNSCSPTTPTPPLAKLLWQESHPRSYCTITTGPQLSRCGARTSPSLRARPKSFARQSLTQSNSEHPHRLMIGFVRSRSAGKPQRRPRQLVQVREQSAGQPGMKMT